MSKKGKDGDCTGFLLKENAYGVITHRMEEEKLEPIAFFSYLCKMKISVSMYKKLILCLLPVLLLADCGGKGCSVPAEPDYADSTQWYIVDRGAAVDFFYIISTECGDYRLDGTTLHYADTRNDSLRRLMAGEMTGVDQLLAGELNYFSPFYRQCTLESFVSDSVMNSRLPLALGDVREAFVHYLKHYNQGRPFILAGFSQGAMAVVDLLQQMDDTTYDRLVAAYVIGYKITDADLKKSRHIRPAQDSADLGVTVCYNSVRDTDAAIPLLSEGNRVAINPVNWRTDASPALLADPRPTAEGAMYTVALDTASLLLLVDGYTRDDYMLPLIGREGNYHCLEISLFRDVLRRNIALRAGKMGK